MAGRIKTPLLFAHIRASTGTPVQRTNWHPFRPGRWLWMHNGAIREFQKVKRDLVMAVDPSLYADIQGSSESETLFFLALTLGLTQDPFGAVARAIGFVEKVGHEHGFEHPFQGTVATSDGESIWAFRYSSERQSRTLYFSTEVDALRKLHPRSRCWLDWARRLGWWCPSRSATYPERGIRRVGHRRSRRPRDRTVRQPTVNRAADMGSWVITLETSLRLRTTRPRTRSGPRWQRQLVWLRKATRAADLDQPISILTT